MGTLSNNSKVGDKGKDLILQTSSRVYVQVKDRFFEINFRGENNEEEEKKEETPQVIFVNSEKDLEDYPYPGDNFLIITMDGKLFQTFNTTYTPLPISAISSTRFSEALTIDTITAPFTISSKQLVKNLNAELLNGVSANSFTRKDNSETISGKWAFNTVNINKISDSNSHSLLDLETGILSIDTINTNKINIASTPPDLEETDSSIDIISKPTYFSNGIKILKSEIITKENYYLQNESIWYSNNENAEVGGYSISELISIAYNDDLLDTFNSLFYYYDLLTIAYKYNISTNTWERHVLQSTDFEYRDDEDPLYLSLKFQPKDRYIYLTVLYGEQDNCATKIYDRWFDISKYTTSLKDKYKGLTFECSIDTNKLVACTELYGTGNKGILEGIVVGGTEDKIRVIISGVDCDFLYMEEEDPEELIESCKEEQSYEKGKTISADIEAGHILFDEDTSNIIGNINNIENSVFGKLKGYGISSEGNCFFVNSNIALSNNINYLKLSNTENSFIGLNSNNQPWLNITNIGVGSINGISYTINSDGNVTLGTGEYQITIDKHGVVKIPQKCIV